MKVSYQSKASPFATYGQNVLAAAETGPEPVVSNPMNAEEADRAR